MTRVQAADPEARRGDPDGVHRLRTSTRRLRSELHALGDMVKSDWRRHLEQELKWLAGLLGGVRDLDILLQRLEGAAQTDPAVTANGDGFPTATERAPLAPFFAELKDRHDRNSRVLRDALQGERYRDLLTTIDAAVLHTPLREEAREPCENALPPIAKAAWKRLRRGGRSLHEKTTDEELHEVRKRAKRARYTAELIAPALGCRAEKRAARFIRLTTRLQDVLGEHQDAIVATAEIEQFLDGQGRHHDLNRAGQKLLEAQRQAADSVREKVFKVWEKLDHKKSLRWLKLGT